MRVFTSKREQIVLEEKPFASGGEGAVYKVISSPRLLKDVCVKIYHVKNNASAQDLKKQKAREDRIKYMVNNPPPQIRGEGYLLGWPLEWVTDQRGTFLGFVMPLGFAGSIELVNLTAFPLSKKLDKEWQKRYDRSLGKTALLSRLKLMCNIAIPVHLIHSTGKYVLEDFKPRNVLVTKEGKVTLVDLDSIQISSGNRLLFPGTAATDEYRPPEYYMLGMNKNANLSLDRSWDMFAVGVVFYQLLFGIHPYTVTPKKLKESGENSPSQNIASNLFPFGKNAKLVEIIPKPHENFKRLPKELKDMFVQTFSDNVVNRPTAASWGKLIHKVVVDEESIGAGRNPVSNPVSDKASDKVSDKTPGKNVKKVHPKDATLNPNDQVPEGILSRLRKWKRIFHIFQISSGLAYAFLPNVYRWNHWSHIVSEENGVTPSAWLFWLPLVLTWLNNDIIDIESVSTKQSLKNHFSSWSWIIYRALLCIAMAAWVSINYLNNAGFLPYGDFYIDDILDTLGGPILCGILWCLALFCLCIMQSIASKYTNKK